MTLYPEDSSLTCHPEFYGQLQLFVVPLIVFLMVLDIFNTGSVLLMLKNVNSPDVPTRDAEKMLFYRSLFQMGT